MKLRDCGSTADKLEFSGSGRGELETVWEISEAAKFLRLHPKTIYRLARAGELPGAQIGNRWRFRPSDLDTWLRSKVISTGTPRRQ